jgi:hypothetical protein
MTAHAKSQSVIVFAGCFLVIFIIGGDASALMLILMLAACHLMTNSQPQLIHDGN